MSKKSRTSRDHLSHDRRSWNMSRIRGKHTTPERVVGSLLRRLGYRYRRHVRIPIAATVGRKKAQDTQKVGRPSCAMALLWRVEASPRAVSVDFLLPKQRIAIFVHGCFWHRHKHCKNCTTPTHRHEWWLKKLNGNAARDKLHQRALRKLGWRPMVIWECQTEKPKTLDRLSRKLSKQPG